MVGGDWVVGIIGEGGFHWNIRFGDLDAEWSYPLSVGLESVCYKDYRCV